MSSLADRLKAKFALVERTEADMHEYQRKAGKFLLDNPFSALFIDTGLGKTVIVLTLIVWLLIRDQFNKVLIVAPVRVAAQTWPNEIVAWEHTACLNATVIRAEDDEPSVIAAGQVAYDEMRAKGFAIKDCTNARGKAQTARKNYLRLKRMQSKAQVHVINREALEWLIDQYTVWVPKKVKGRNMRVRKIVGWPYDVVILDESSSFKDHTSRRFKALAAVRQQGFIKRLHELTATPAAEGYLGLFAQAYLLDLGKRLGRFITKYREEFFVENKYGHTFKIRNEKAMEEISDKLADISLVMKEEDYLKGQVPLFLDRKINMRPAELALYQKLERDFVMTLPDGEVIEAETAASLSSKLLQLASGAVYDSDGKTHVVHDHKLEDLAQLQEELQGSPILVAYWYKSSLARLRKAFPKAAVMDPAGKIVSRHGPWNTGKVEMLLVHPASVGHGLNMQYGPGHDLYMFDQCWSFELFYQLYRRLARQGQKKQVRIHLPQMQETNDPLVVKRLRMKQDAQEFLFRRIMRQWKKWADETNYKEAA